VRDFLGRTIILKGRVVDVRPGSTVVSVREAPSSDTHPHPHPLPEGEEAVLVCSDDETSRLGNGQECYVAVRPEHVSVVPALGDEGPAGDNRLRGVVEALLFVGERYEARIVLPWGDTILAYLPPNAFWQEGQTVSLSFPS